MTTSSGVGLAAERLSEAAALGTSLSEPLLAVMPVDGVAVSTLVAPFETENLSSTDVVSARIDQYQLDLGEGPCWDALSQGQPAMTSDLAEAHERWPLFRHALADENVRAVYAFPLVVGSLDIGAVDLYSSSPNTMGDADVENAIVLAHIISTQVLQQALARVEPGSDGSGDPGWFSRREVHQATGMLMARHRVTPADGLLILRARAFAEGRPVLEVAQDLIADRAEMGPSE